MAESDMTLAEKLLHFVELDEVLTLVELIEQVTAVRQKMPESLTSAILEHMEYLLELLTGGNMRATFRVNDRMKMWCHGRERYLSSLRDGYLAIPTYLLSRDPLYPSTGYQTWNFTMIAMDFLRLNYIMTLLNGARPKMNHFQDMQAHLLSVTAPFESRVNSFLEFVGELEAVTHKIMVRILTLVPPETILSYPTPPLINLEIRKNIHKFYKFKTLVSGELEEYLLTPTVEFAFGWNRLWRKVYRASTLEFLYWTSENDVCMCMEVIPIDHCGILDSCDHLLCEPCARACMVTPLDSRKCPFCHTPARTWLPSRLFGKLKSVMKKRKGVFIQGGACKQGNNFLATVTE